MGLIGSTRIRRRGETRMAETGQTYSNHVRFFPLFHFFVAPVLMVNMFVALWGAIKAPSIATGWGFVVAATLVALALASRLMALSVQDRVIRLEMRRQSRSEEHTSELQSRLH